MNSKICILKLTLQSFQKNRLTEIQKFDTFFLNFANFVRKVRKLTILAVLSKVGDFQVHTLGVFTWDGLFQ